MGCPVNGHDQKGFSGFTEFIVVFLFDTGQSENISRKKQGTLAGWVRDLPFLHHGAASNCVHVLYSWIEKQMKKWLVFANIEEIGSDRVFSVYQKWVGYNLKNSKF
jgi:hypothetical protein